MGDGNAPVRTSDGSGAATMQGWGAEGPREEVIQGCKEQGGKGRGAASDGRWERGRQDERWQRGDDGQGVMAAKESAAPHCAVAPRAATEGRLAGRRACRRRRSCARGMEE